jgi:LETM1 and EF-hand domain-containing protein 1
MKMIPFSFFLVIPGAEALLPAYLKIFPNSLPSQFISDSDRKKKFHTLHENQQVAADKLLIMWPKYLQALIDNPKVNEEDKVLI